jgi:DNA-binding beta-propeller fold protein YncE
VSSRGDGTVKRIDLDTNTVTDSVAVGVQPESVMLTPSERTLLVSLRETPATLAFVDTVKPALIGTVQIAGAGTFGDLAVITKDGRHVYATFDAAPNGSGGVAVVDVRERKVRRYVGVPRHRAPPRDLVLQEEAAIVAVLKWRPTAVSRRPGRRTVCRRLTVHRSTVPARRST